MKLVNSLNAFFREHPKIYATTVAVILGVSGLCHKAQEHDNLAKESRAYAISQPIKRNSESVTLDSYLRDISATSQPIVDRIEPRECLVDLRERD